MKQDITYGCARGGIAEGTGIAGVVLTDGDKVAARSKCQKANDNMIAHTHGTNERVFNCLMRVCITSSRAVATHICLTF